MKTTGTDAIERIDWNEISKRGLMERINREVMHPLGLAVFRDPETGLSGGALVSPDGKWEYAPDAAKVDGVVISTDHAHEERGDSSVYVTVTRARQPGMTNEVIRTEFEEYEADTHALGLSGEHAAIECARALERIRRLRNGEGYGEHSYLSGKWDGWRAAYWFVLSRINVHPKIDTPNSDAN